MYKRMVRLVFTLNMAIFSGMITVVSATQTELNSKYVVKYKEGKEALVRNALQNASAKVNKEIKKLNVLAVDLNPMAAEALRNNPNIEYIENEVKGRYFAQRTPYTNPMIQADLLTAAGVGLKKVCIIDTGIELAHEDFDSGLITGTAAEGEGDWFTDEEGHGTYMSGAIIAVNNDIGVIGLAHGTVSLHFHKMGMDFSSTRVAEGIVECMNQNANLISMSFGISNTNVVQDAVALAFNNNVLLVSSAGNDEDTSLNYPASYSQVMSVAAVDKNKAHAYYSNRNAEVEIAAPGSRVWGTTPMGKRVETATSFNNQSLDTLALYGTPVGSVSAQVVDCAGGRKTCKDVNQKICLIKASKMWVTTSVQNCEAGGGIGVMVYNDAIHAYDGQVGVQFDNQGNPSVNIPGVDISDAMAADILANPTAIATIDNFASNYVRAYGTSISSPIVAGAAAVVWSHHQDCSNQEIRDALNASAEDLGDIGRDDSYGFGLVQMAAAKSYLDANPCGVVPPQTGIELNVSQHKEKGKWYADLSWNNATSGNVDIYRDGILITTVANTGSFSEGPLSGTYIYQVCEESTTDCSAEVTINL
ncbi:S8 family serine peptidase [Aliikangiella sp. G2MR2-5]|uniref:S8 family serine peptidase n=1 Tax=Aliikangiella sp. G2MR2-5 TaxID=2788943 RepID=UPI0018AC54D4|nr:S8 family serine peptidase [Aliikangiella sp. G2MR2-5]